MHEKLTPQQQTVAIEASRVIERARRILLHPTQFTLEEVEEARSYLPRQMENLVRAIDMTPDPDFRLIITQIALGTFHHGET
jgi:hypothetical protein